jgi:hypothetical protein
MPRSEPRRRDGAKAETKLNISTSKARKKPGVQWLVLYTRGRRHNERGSFGTLMAWPALGGHGTLVR